MKVIFNKVQRFDIFEPDFNEFTSNNTFDFDRHRVVVVYGPNGSGKSSLAAVLSKKEDEAEYSVSIDGTIFTNQQETPFHIINDQNGRNIISGNTEDFILGDNIKREYELKRNIESQFDVLFRTTLSGELKQQFGISTRTHPFVELVKVEKLREFISDLANQKSKGDNIDRKDFINTVKTLTVEAVPDYDPQKLQFFIDDWKAKGSAIKGILELNLATLKAEPQYLKIDESTVAIKVLTRFDYIDDCIVCDNPSIDRDSLIVKKQKVQEVVKTSLSDFTKKILEEVITSITGEDPFNIRETLLDAIKSGNINPVNQLITDIDFYRRVYSVKISNFFVENLNATSLEEESAEYENLTGGKPEFENEDIIFIEKFLNSCLDRKIELKRDDDNNLRLLLGDQEFLEKGREKLSLSNGEQNFLSLSFELLKAKKVVSELIVLDDPISSFDSIYKNKIAYAILKFLETKKSIVLTHNIDLIKLLEHQKQNSFRMYILNNTVGEVNGFIPLTPKEVEILIYIPKLINLFRSGIKEEIVNERLFAYALVPFMRGYCQIINHEQYKDELTNLMHGYKDQAVNVTHIYSDLFGPILQDVHIVTAQQLLEETIDDISILREDNYPLLNKTLVHSLTYLYLRMSVERALVQKYNINTDKFCKLTQIITESFRGAGQSEIENRMFFLSRKTLLNEFNHFEIDMNVFQPAIDITTATLRKEYDDISSRISAL
jgi:ABC-type lipoprotein export system ATPase subunit